MSQHVACEPRQNSGKLPRSIASAPSGNENTARVWRKEGGPSWLGSPGLAWLESRMALLIVWVGRTRGLAGRSDARHEF